MKEEEAGNQLNAFARWARELGFRVKYSTRTETEGCNAGETFIGITIETMIEGDT